MAYLDVITLLEAKNHLRIDPDVQADDFAIERMIKSALELVEQKTNHILYQRNKTYYRSVDEKRITVFDYPINDYDTEVTALHYSLKHEFVTDKITLDVGYVDRDDIPSALLDAAFQLLEDWYFESETEGINLKVNDRINQLIFNYKRCIVS